MNNAYEDYKRDCKIQGLTELAEEDYEKINAEMREEFWSNRRLIDMKKKGVV